MNDDRVGLLLAGQKSGRPKDWEENPGTGIELFPVKYSNMAMCIPEILRGGSKWHFISYTFSKRSSTRRRCVHIYYLSGRLNCNEERVAPRGVGGYEIVNTRHNMPGHYECHKRNGCTFRDTNFPCSSTEDFRTAASLARHSFECTPPPPLSNERSNLLSK